MGALGSADGTLLAAGLLAPTAGLGTMMPGTLGTLGAGTDPLMSQRGSALRRAAAGRAFRLPPLQHCNFDACAGAADAADRADSAAGAGCCKGAQAAERRLVG